MQGDWIKVHRKVQDSRVFSDPEMFWVFMKCLLKANWKTGYFGGQEILPGQFAFSYRNLAADWEMSKNRLVRALKKLESWECISIKAGRDFSTLTVCNYTSYQTAGKQSGTRADTPTDTHVDTPADTPTGRERTPIEERQELKEGKKKKKAGSPKEDFDPTQVDLPFASQAFRQSWLEWCAYRKRKGNEINQDAWNKQRAKISKFAEHEVIAAIDHAIECGHTGLFPKSIGKSQSQRGPVDTSTEGLMQQMELGGVRWAN